MEGAGPGTTLALRQPPIQGRHRPRRKSGMSCDVRPQGRRQDTRDDPTVYANFARHSCRYICAYPSGSWPEAKIQRGPEQRGPSLHNDVKRTRGCGIVNICGEPKCHGLRPGPLATCETWRTLGEAKYGAYALAERLRRSALGALKC